MEKEGIVLGHRISAKVIEVDRAKVNSMEKLPQPISINVFSSFVGYAGFYRRIIKEFSKISKPLCKLFEKERDFLFDENCMKASQCLEDKLVVAPVIIALDWSKTFEIICNSCTVTLGAVLGPKKLKLFPPIYYVSYVLNSP